MLRQLRVTSVAVSLLVGLSLTACGTESSSSGTPSRASDTAAASDGTWSSSTGGTPAAPAGSGDSTSDAGAPTGSQEGFPIVMSRTGGIAGVSNRMTINADGTAVFEGRSGKRQCTVDQAVMEKLAVESAKVMAVAPPKPDPSKPPMPDAFVDSISVGTARAAEPGATPETKALSDLAWPLFLEVGGGSPMPKAPAAGSGITCQ